MLRGEPRTFTPLGVSDALDEARAFPGACRALINLIPDPTTRGVWQARPAAVQLTDFTGFTTPGFVSALTVINGIAYGLVASGRNAGKDEPFAFNLASGLFQTVSGVTAGNTPTSPAATGDWVPPTMALVGVRLIVTHPGFSGANRFGWFDLSTPGAPAWSAGNTTGTLLPAVPVAVAKYMDRAWFAVNLATAYSSTYFTDTNGSLNLTRPTQIITYGDNVPIIGMKVMPFTNGQDPGINQALIVFKGSPEGASQIYQVTGDASQTYDTTTNIASVETVVQRSTLRVDEMHVPTTSVSALAAAVTPIGLLFVSPDGLRVLDQGAVVQKPIGAWGEGVNAPFLQQATASRTVAAASAGVYRVSFSNTLAGGAFQEYWFDLVRGVWSGPHTFPASLIAPFGNSFVMTPQGVLASLWKSDVQQGLTSSFTENGADLLFELRTVPMTDRGLMAQFSAVETAVCIAASGPADISVNAFDELATNVGVDVYTVEGAQSLWGQFDWGSAPWSGSTSLYRPRRIDWDRPLVYRRLEMSVSGKSTKALKIGDIFVREEVLGYEQQYP